ncbi:hypothetical protein BDY19DRAFT_988133 [Irpex rosettiformis]|uniref:Uncharacterized protein n=1 Tax=Irpex rosettiformis TaxID=378272 RepID=A0ACB8UIR7_9APHY|nr:hypothetical protein BDY19DRAFT_988133 [Irpex rosettiformis]
MPIKHPARERAWGSRYDTLKSSPSPSNQTSPVPTNTATPQSPIAIQTANASPPNDDRPSDIGQSPVTPNLKGGKPSNDNSIFVGSLPTNIEPIELGYMLTQHLAEYPQIKDVKAIRDSKGSVCAFLACEDATAASQLLKNLQEFPPKLFHNRALRFEFARASRSLIISYRAPARLPYPNSGLESPNESASLSPNVSSDLPSAIRIFRPKNAKYPAILYDSEAINFDLNVVPTAVTNNEDAPVAADMLSGSGVLIEPLGYDAETLKKIVATFGPIEFFGPFVPNKEGDGSIDSVKALRPFADISRSPRMEEGVWEVKWQRRDDSVVASMILRRVPHLHIIWAHHLNSDSGPDSRFASPTTSPGPFHPSMSRSRHLSRSHVNEFEYQRGQDQFPHFSPNMHPSTGNLRHVMSPYSEGALSPQFNHWSPSYTSRHARGPSSPLVQRDDAEKSNPIFPSGRGFNDTDFPPLHDPGRSKRLNRPPSLQWIARGDQQAETRNNVTTQSPSPSSSLSVQPCTPGVARSIPSPVTEGQDAQSSQPPLSPAVADDVSNTDLGQELTIPPTPEFTTASITPVTPKTNSSYPLTPQSARTMGSVASFDNHHMTPRRGGRFGVGNTSRDEGDTGREVDPCSVFVGNLEVNTPPGWSEERLRDVFGKYGRLEDVAFHTPVAKNVGFAFLRYADAESSLRAISGEHERVYDGRLIRVQIREVKPSGQRITPFKGARGRGRPRMYGDIPRHFPSPGCGADFHDRSHDEFSGYSPQSSQCRTPYRQETRYSSTGRDLPPHLSRGPITTEPPALAPRTGTCPVENKGPSPPFDVNGSSWATPTRHAECAIERPTIPSSSTSASVSPPPSSHGSQPSSAMAYVPPYPMMMPWMHPYHPYPYPMPYMTTPYMGYPAHTMAPYPPPMMEGSGADAAASQQQVWDAQAQMYKRPMAYPATSNSTAANVSSAYPGSGSNGEVHPPVRAVAFEHTSTGMFVPMYPPDALNQYMSTHGPAVPSEQITPPQAPVAQPQQQQQPVPSSTYTLHHPMSHMPLYPYPYAPQIAMAPAGNQPAVTPGGQYQSVAGGWTNGAILATQSATSPTHLQPVPSSTYLAPSQTVSTQLSNSVSFGGHYAGTGSAQGDQHYGGPRGTVPPRRGTNRMQSYNNKNFNSRASPNHVQRHASESHFGASHSFVDGISTPGSHQPASGGMRPYSGRLVSQ